VIDESKSDAAEKAARFPGARWALALGFALLAGFSIIVVWSSIDRGKRASFETSEQVTGVEDKVYFSIPPQIKEPTAAVAKLGGKSLYLASRDALSVHDSDVRRVARDSATGLTIYEAADRRVLSSKEKGNTYLLKVETGRYVKVRAGPTK
jgi:hypothetical protein